MIFKVVSSDTYILSFRGAELPVVQWPSPIRGPLDPTLTLKGLIHNGDSWRKSFQQWITNFWMELTPFPQGVEVHQGFYNGASRLVEKFKVILQNDQKQSSSNFRLFITGHSQGAALALVAAAILHFDGLPISAVRAFASPFVSASVVHNFELQCLVINGKGNHALPDGSRGILRQKFEKWMESTDLALIVESFRLTKGDGGYQVQLNPPERMMITSLS